MSRPALRVRRFRSFYYLLSLCQNLVSLASPVQAPVRLPHDPPRDTEQVGIKHLLLCLFGIEYPERQKPCQLALIDKTEQSRSEYQPTPTPAQSLGMEDAIRSICGGECCTYVLNSGIIVANLISSALKCSL